MTKELQIQCNHIFNKDSKKMGIRLIKFNGKAGIIKCNHTEKENTIRLLQTIKKIASNKIGMITIATSGTIRSLIKKHMSVYL
jgi:RNase P/RNase MRP subunit POP5